MASVEVLLRPLSGGVSCFSLPLPLSLSSLQRRVETLHCVPPGLQRLYADGRLLCEANVPSPAPSSFLCVSLSLPLLGGKGGFGSLLRATTSQVGAKRTTDFSSMRDLHGRRRRHVEQERELEEWRRKEEGKSEEEKQRERRELQRRVADLNKGRAAARLQPCRWGMQCKYRSSCRRSHPDDEGEGGEEKEGGERVGKRRKGGAGDAVALFDGSWQAQVVDEEEMREDLHVGLRLRGSRAGPTSDDEGEEDGDEEEEAKRERAEEVKEAPSRPSSSPAAARVLPSPLRSAARRRAAAAVAVASEEADETKEGGSASDAPPADERNEGLILTATAASSPPAQSTAPPSDPPPSSSSDAALAPIDLSLFSSAASLEPLGLAALSAELHRRGLKTGGRLAERAERLFFCKGCAADDIPARMRATTKGSAATSSAAVQNR